MSPAINIFADLRAVREQRYVSYVASCARYQLLCRNLYGYSSILGERGFYANGYMTLIETKDLQVCFLDVWIAFLMDNLCRVCVCCLCPCSAAPFPFELQPLFRCAAIIGFLATDICLVPWRVYTDSALAPCLVLLVFMDRHYVAGRSSVEGPPVPVRTRQINYCVDCLLCRDCDYCCVDNF